MQASIKYIRKELAGVYPKEEIEGFVRLLFQHLKNYQLTDLLMKADEQLSPEETKQIKAIVDRLKQHEPIQYILGETEFFGLPFQVNQHVLIPRPETEELVQWILNQYAGTSPTILDVGTGSGCIPISLKHKLPEANIWACDISKKALETAQANARLNDTEIHFFEMDILHPQLPESFPALDVLVSNPPYVTKSEKEQMHPNVLEFEPSGALFVPDHQPLLFYRALADFAKKHLSQTGSLFWEINEAYGEACIALLKEKGFSNVQLKKDINGKDRMIFATCSTI